MSELDVLRRLGDQIVPPSFETLEETAHRRVRRARVATSLVVAATVAAVGATTVYLERPDRRSEPAPTPAPRVRPLTYADGRTIHYGDHTIDADGPVAELDVTDEGVGFRTADGRIWFTDGSTVDRLGSLGEPGAGYGDDTWPLMVHPGWMLSSNAGSRLVWFEFPAPGEPEVVVYDTGAGQEVARDPVGSQPGHTAVPAQLSDRFVYWFRDPSSEEMAEDTVLVRYDPTSGEQSRSTERELLDDLDGAAAVRSIRLKGDGRWDASNTFHYDDGLGQQMGLDLRKGVAGADGVAPVGPGDMVAEDVGGRPFEFEPPTDYSGKSGVAWLVQWLDDQTVAVVSPLRHGTDLIECHLDTKTCEVAESVPAEIVVPDLGKSQFIG